MRARLDEAFERAEGYRQHCERLIAAAAPRASSFEALVEEAVQFLDEFAASRPEHEVYVPEVDRRKGARSPGKGRSGREEWT